VPVTLLRIIGISKVWDLFRQFSTKTLERELLLAIAVAGSL
jgi:hypothetical protein